MKKLLIALYVFFVTVTMANAVDILDKVYSVQFNDQVYSLTFQETPFSGTEGCSSGDAILEDSEGNSYKLNYEYFCTCKMGYLNGLYFTIRGNTLSIYSKVLDMEEVEQ